MTTIRQGVRAWMARRAVAAGALALVGVYTYAQGVDEAVRRDAARRDQQEQRRQGERDRVQREAMPRPADVFGAAGASEPARGWPATESPCFAIERIVLDGDAAADFTWALEPLTLEADGALGRCLGTEGLGVAVGRVQQRLMERGFVTTRVLLPPQDLSGGALTLTLLPGRISAIRFVTGTRDRATWRNAVPARVGDILNLRDIEQGLENLKRVPTVQADIRIEPAEQPGYSELVISWTQSFPFRFSASVDDSGTKSTGRYQGSVTASYDHWWTLNDLFYLTLNRDLGGGIPGRRGTRGHTAHYSLPWGYWLLGATASDSSYHQNVAGAEQDYIYSGGSQSAEVQLSRLVHRNASSKTTLNLKGWLRRSYNFIDDTELQTQRRATGGWELGLSHKVSMDRATLEIGASHRQGTGAFRAMPAPEEAFGEGTSRMRVSRIDINLQAPFQLAGHNLRYQGVLRGQWNGTPLSPQDRFAIGGRYTVRGFDGESSLSAERGWLLRNEFGVPLGDSGHELYLGLDYGQVSGPATEWLVGDHLAGVVLGLRGGVKGVSYDLFIGRPVRKPAYFRTAPVTAGFSLSTSF